MQPNDLSALNDIEACCREVILLAGRCTEDSFLDDSVVQAAMKYHLIILGEAVKRLSTGFRQLHPEMRWAAMAGLRDVLVHAYERIDSLQVWDIATASVPSVFAYIEPLIPHEQL